MSTQARTVEFLLEQMGSIADITARKMFGEYALYLGSKVVALVCDDQLFVKPTVVGRAWIEGSGRKVAEGCAYQGAKPSLLISSEDWDDRDWLSQLIQVTAAELPLPQPKKVK